MELMTRMKICTHFLTVNMHLSMSDSDMCSLAIFETEPFKIYLWLKINAKNL